MKLVGCKSALNHTHTPTVVYSADRSKAVFPVLVLLFVALWLPCVIVFLRFLSLYHCDYLAFRTFVRFALVWFCLFSLPLGVCDGLQLVILTLPGFFSCHFDMLISILIR